MKVITTTATKPNPLAAAFAEPASIDEEIEFRKLTVVEELLQFMKRQGIKRGELAVRMGVPPSRITKMLDGSENLTIATMVRAGHAVGADLHLTFAPTGSKVSWSATESSPPQSGSSARPVSRPRSTKPETSAVLHENPAPYRVKKAK